MYGSKTSFIVLMNVFRLTKAPSKNIGISKRLINTAAVTDRVRYDNVCGRQYEMPGRHSQCSLNGVASLIPPSRKCYYACNLVSERKFSTRSNPNLSFEEFRDLLNSNDIQVIDVREPEELETDGRIPKAVNIPLSDVASALALPPHKFQAKYSIDISEPETVPIVFSCKAGSRSQAALQKAHELGFQNARHFGGGFLEWSERMKSEE